MIGGRACVGWAVPLLLLGAAPAVAAENGEAALTRLVDEFTRAQRDFDQAALRRLTTADYLEISPVGDVDTRDEMIGFYAPDKKRPAPELAVSERSVRRNGDTGMVVAKLRFAVPGPDGTRRDVAMRASFVARRSGEGWKLAGAQYTPIPTRP